MATRYGFVEYDGPPLEPLELYTKKSGDEIVGQLYNFTDKGGREVALRPEMTPTLARMVAARANALREAGPLVLDPAAVSLRAAAAGPAARALPAQLDIIGEPGPLGDAELLALAIDVMRAFGLGRDDVVRACPTAACSRRCCAAPA